MSVAINPVFPVIAEQGVTADVILQPGSVIDARVMKLLANDFVRISLSNLSIDVLSEVPLQIGQALQLAVSQTANGVRLQIVPQSLDEAAASLMSGSSASRAVKSDAVLTQGALNAAPVIRPLTSLEALAVSAAMQSAAARQGSLSPLFANLGIAAASQSLPSDLQQASVRLLAERPALDHNLTGDVVKTAFRQSGLFHGQAQAGAAPDLKAALIVFRKMLASWLGDGVSGAQETPLRSPGAFAQQGQARAQADMAASLSAPSLAPQIEVDEVLLPQSALPTADDISEFDAPLRQGAPGTALATLARAGAWDGVRRVAGDVAGLSQRRARGGASTACRPDAAARRSYKPCQRQRSAAVSRCRAVGATGGHALARGRCRPGYRRPSSAE